MAQFTYTDYQEAVEAAKSGKTQQKTSQKVGFFKLRDDGDEAIVRFNVSSLDSLHFATVHVVKTGDNKWTRVSCLNKLGQYGDECPLCGAVSEENETVGKASKRVFVQMLVAYKDPTTGTYSEPVPVIWEKAAGFSRELANFLKDYGDLTKTLFKVTRNGKKGDMQTTYSISYAVPTVFKPEMVPEDFSAFENFNIAKHSYWEKTAEEIKTFLETGAFPEVERETTAEEVKTTTIPAEKVSSTPVVDLATEVKAETPAPAPTPATETKKFGGFSF